MASRRLHLQGKEKELERKMSGLELPIKDLLSRFQFIAA
jgi:hypothetical protein